MRSRHIASKKASTRRKEGVGTRPERRKKSAPIPPSASAIQLFDPVPGTVYSIEQAAQLANVSRRRILIYCKERLLSPMASPELAGYWFDAEALRALRRIEELRAVCDEPLASVGLILDLMREVRRLRNELRALEV
jgi:MerR HTH family regulatory protein